MHFAVPTVSVPTADTVNSVPLRAIVLVDDERSYTDLLTQMLSDNLACPVHAFARPMEALKALPRLNPGVIVTDYYMPQLNGLEFIRQASLVVPDTHFVVITGHNLSSEEDAMARIPALKGFLEKPFGWRKLADEILRVWPSHCPVPTHRADAPSL
ncbi:MAG: response regulator [Verrucomicrobia bacterium]|nr:response regulator [Verrucomicrobiota bacterium]